MKLEWPQITWFVLVLISLGVSVGKHGEPKEGNHNFWYSLIGTVIAFWIFYSGGFFG